MTAALCRSDFLPHGLGGGSAMGGVQEEPPWGAVFPRYLPALLVYRLLCLRPAKYKVPLALNANDSINSVAVLKQPVNSPVV